MRCPACHIELTGRSRFCPDCGGALDASAVPTVAMSERKPPSSSSGTDEGRFPAGTVLGERYRILGLLGRGGMGEVYRAFDLKLDQTVALKFLPAAATRDSRLLERFRGEVRVARQVSHRNVCRVHDIGEADGAAFISMEYVDGEDLGSLLRRIGRLPGDKAIEFARRLCAGLAAAHEKGVLHRDLKPANIMIDGRGQVLIMDFGLAAAADAIAGGDIRSGTPAYMAPEQKEGREVTVRSDIYSLGLVLAEMFTGQKASQDAKLSTTVKDIDPAVEKVIQRCLDPNPSKRPSAALDVARALPGGDPLAEALAAGDTPSPEMVAASEDTGALSVRAAVVCMAFIVAGMAALVFWGSRNTVINLTPMPYSSDVLLQKVRDLSIRLGYIEPPVNEIHRFEPDRRFQGWASGTLPPERYRALLGQGQPAAVVYFYVRSPRALIPPNQIESDNFDQISGRVDVRIDPQGRLVSLRAMPNWEAKTPATAADWTKIVEAAGLDSSSWTPAEPQEAPASAFDERKAWVGRYTELPQVPVRIEAAAWRGRLVSFEIFGPWRPTGGRSTNPGGQSGGVFTIIGILIPLIPLFAFVFGLRNFRNGRGDVDGAVRSAAFIAMCTVVADLLRVPWTGAPRVLNTSQNGLSFGVLAWALYMSVEPYVRRHWPQALIGWTRALGGNFRDPIVAGHILVGIAVGLATDLLIGNFHGVRSDQFNLSLQTTEIVSGWFGDVAIPPLIALAVAFLFVLLRLVLRRGWIAAAIIGVLVAVRLANGSLVELPFAIVGTALLLGVSIRFGILALSIAIISNPLDRYPLTPNFSAWFAPLGWMEVAFVLAVSLWAFRNALGGRKVLKGDFLEN